jgi:hypothetical protein
LLTKVVEDEKSGLSQILQLIRPINTLLASGGLKLLAVIEPIAKLNKLYHPRERRGLEVLKKLIRIFRRNDIQ